MVRSIFSIKINNAKKSLKNNFFNNPQQKATNNNLFVNSLDSISFSKNISPLDYLKSKSIVEKSMDKFLKSKNLLKNKYNNTISFGRNTFNYLKKFTVVNYKKTLWSIKKALKPSFVEKLAEKPVIELKEMLLASLQKVA